MHMCGKNLTNDMVILPPFQSYDWHGSLSSFFLSVFNNFYELPSHDSHVAKALFVDSACVFVL